MPGTLYMLPNRIADRPVDETIPQGVLETARRTRYFLAENAKSARLYLKEAGHPGPISALSITEIGHEPDASMIRSWLQPVLAGEDACIVSESGCPGVADPGATLVAEAKRLGVRVVPMTGPCSIILTLMASGLNGQRFRFLGYLPIDEAQRTKAIQDLERQSRTPETQLFIETPYRNNRLLQALASSLSPDTLVTAATDVTGPGESISTRTAGEWLADPVELPKLPTVFAVLARPGAHPREGIKTRQGQPGKAHLPSGRTAPARAKPGRH